LVRAIEQSSAHLVRLDRSAALAVLAAVPPPQGAEPLLTYAVAVHVAGDPSRAQSLVAGLPPTAPIAVRAVAAWMRGQVANETALRDFWPQRHPDCKSAVGAQLLHRLQQPQLAAALYRAIRGHDPACRAAWMGELRARSDLAATPEAEATAAAALQQFGGDPDVLDAAASMSRRLKDFARAIPRYEQLGAIEPPRPRVLGHLSNAVMHSHIDTKAALARYLARVTANPKDDVARFMAGVLLHYQDEYQRSNEMFAPLVGRRDSEDRLWVYMAMNDFNLGNRQQALKTLNRIAQQPHPDPDVYYCRAEITRDTDRVAAARDLRLYLGGSGPKDPAHAAKEARVTRMIAALERCQKDNPAVCEGEWEHPRKQREAAFRNRILLACGTTLLLVAGALVALRRRRRRV
jgi:tetratricopeptide (TPR) repeat protein